jgi:hypothetical protein
MEMSMKSERPPMMTTRPCYKMSKISLAAKQVMLLLDSNHLP